MKLKKLLSGILAVSILTACNAGMVMADDKGSVTYVDADPEAIYVYSDVQYLDPANVKAASTLIQDGVDITSDCTFTRVTDNLTGGGIGNDYRWCTRITLTDGSNFEVDTPISLSITGNSQINDYSKKFAIYELFYDDFTNSISNWTAASENTLTHENGMLKMTMPASNSYNKYLAHTNYASQTSWTDYTISFDYLLNSTNDGFHSVRVEYSTQTSPSAAAGIASGDYAFMEQTGALRLYNPAFGSDGYSFRQYSDTSSQTVAGQTKHMKMSTTNNYMQAWTNGYKSIDYNNSAAVTGAPVFTVQYDGGTIYFDNIRATRVVDLSEVTELAINSYEADTDAITVYPSAEIDTDVLQSAITLTEDGTEVDVTVSEVELISGYLNKNSTAPAYKITKTSGFECDKIYNLTIGELLSSDLTQELSTEYTRIFKIEEILADDFSGDTSKWTLAHSNPSVDWQGSNTLAVADGKLKLTTGTANADEHVLMPADYLNMLTLEDYTVEFDFNVGDTYTNNYMRFGLTTEERPDISNTSLARFHVQANGVRDFLAGNSSYEFTNATTYPANYKFVAKDNRYVLYVNDVKMYDYTTDGLDAKGAFGILPYVESRDYYFDNFKFTKVVDLTDVTELTINSYEADTDAITVYPSAEIDTDVLQSAITLTEGGTEVDVTVSEVELISGYLSKNSTAPAYKITKTGGFECDKIYNLTINGLLSADESALMTDAFKKTFKIEEILADDFSGDTSKWTLAHSNPSVDWQGSNTLAVADGKLKLTTGTANADEHVLMPADYLNMLTLEDYTVEFDFNVGDAYTGNYMKFGLTTEERPDISNTSLARFHVQANGVRDFLAGDGTYGFTNATTYPANYKFVAKDNRYVLYVNDVKMYDYTTNGLDAKGAFGILPYEASRDYYFDNFKFTKVVELADEVEISGVTINNGAITDIAGEETVDINVVVLNTYTESKPCEVVVAVYDSSNDDMKNIKVFDVKTLECGENEFPVEDFAINGADRMKVFVFDGFNTLTPYCSPLVIE